MRMTGLEKRFVNAEGHTQNVIKAAEKLLCRLPLQAGQNYLDVGCGNGAVALHMAQTSGLHTQGVDADPQQIKLAHTSAAGVEHVQFMVGDATHLLFADATFDVVSTLKMTHHIPNWQNALAELLRVTAPGGYLVYVDFVFPGTVASVCKVVLGGLMGFPTRNGIEEFVQQNRLTVIHHGGRFPYEVIWQKP